MKIKTLTVDIDPKGLTFDAMRALTDEFLKSNPKEGKKYWDCMAALRGPDVGLPSDDGTVMPALANGNSPAAESARISRKNLTTAIIRAHMFPGAAGCSAAQMNTDPDAQVVLPDKEKWDHFDKHVFKAAQWLGLPIQIGDKKPLMVGGMEGSTLAIDTKYSPCKIHVPGISMGDLMEASEFQPNQMWQFVSTYTVGGAANRCIMQHVTSGKQYIVRVFGDFVKCGFYLCQGIDGDYLRFAPTKQANQETKKLPKPLPPNPWGITKGYFVQVSYLDEWIALHTVVKDPSNGIGYVSIDDTQVLLKPNPMADYYTLYMTDSKVQQAYEAWKAQNGKLTLKQADQQAQNGQAMPTAAKGDKQ